MTFTIKVTRRRLALLTTLGVLVAAYGATAGVPVRFQAHTTIRAAEINQNFDSLSEEIAAQKKNMAAAAALSICKIREDNLTTDVYRVREGQSGNEVCASHPNFSGCREVHLIYLYGDRGEGAEETLQSCDFRAGSDNADLQGTFACCIR